MQTKPGKSVLFAPIKICFQLCKPDTLLYYYMIREVQYIYKGQYKESLCSRHLLALPYRNKNFTAEYAVSLMVKWVNLM